MAAVPDGVSDLVTQGGDLVRRGLRNFESEVTKVGILLAAVTGGFQIALAIANVVVFLLFVHQFYTTRFSSWIGSNFRNFADHFARLDRVEWLIAQASLIMFLYWSVKVRQRMLQKEMPARSQML
jgi:hypothetical protein